MNRKKLIIFCIIFLLFFLSIVFTVGQAQTVSDNSSNDAIAVRIVPNPNHLSVYRWYENQGFTGSPQAFTVDGYDAIRDGRTVYVGAANINDKLIFTNIYFISYNQDPSANTIDILGQIIKNWKFNTDLEKNIPASSCSISATACLNNDDCPKDQFCASSGQAASSCQLKTAVNCLIDTDCPQNFFCDSLKAKIVRDVKRIGTFGELSDAIAKYKLINGYYPKLKAGTYLSGYTVSVWPSWPESFLPAIGMTQSFIDPINRLGACPNNFDIKTCWDSVTGKFVNPLVNNGSLVLPAGSYGFAYRTDSEGSVYNLCSVMETRAPELNFQFSPNMPATSTCVTAVGIITSGTSVNTPPRLTDYYLTGEAGQEFNGFIKVVDDQNNPLTWSINTDNDFGWAHWSAPPILKDTGSPNQKKIYADKAGDPRKYNFLLTVSDGQGGVSTTTLNITLINPKPIIEAENYEYNLDPIEPFNYSFYFSDNNLNIPATAYTLTPVSPVNNNFSLLSTYITKSAPVIAGFNRYQVTFKGLVPFATFPNNTDYSYHLSVIDKYATTSTKDFKITIKNTPPNLDFNCPTQLRLGNQFSCLLGANTQGNHTISYSAVSIPSNWRISKSNGSNSLSSLVGLANSPFYHRSIAITATNEYGASSAKSFILDVNSYCGDGTRQLISPNTEGRGGPNNDGFEDCDGTDGVTADVKVSNIKNQYGCTTTSSATPYPILSNNYCVYKSPTNGGGYCGDGICEAKIGTPLIGYTMMENITNCPNDCAPICQPKTCADLGYTCGSIDNGCGQTLTCGSCSDNQACNSGACCAKNATIQTSVDNFQTTYFDGTQVSTTVGTGCTSECCNTYPAYLKCTDTANIGCCWKAIQKFPVTVQDGKNVIAVKAIDTDLNYGVALTYNQEPCKSMTTASTSDWKCTNSAQSGTAWTAINFDDYSWSSARLTNFTDGNALAPTVKQIWAQGDNGISTIYCRYSFFSNTSANSSGCGDGKCEGDENLSNCPKDCSSVSCTPKTCADQGADCGTIGDTCGNTLTCPACATGSTCNNATHTCSNGLTCTGWTYSDWYTCVNGSHRHDITSSSPAGCSGGTPILSEACTLCTSFEYTDWQIASNNPNILVRWITKSTPPGCIDQNSITVMQRPTCNYWTYSPWVISSTDSNYITRTILTSSPDWCIGGISVTTQERPTCTSWTYSDWSGCSNGSKTRQILTASPDWCIGGNPDILSSCCSPKNCAELGADCGTVDDGCGNILTCNNSCKAPTPSCIQNKCVGCASDANCQTGYYCSTWASSMLSCNPNAASNTCQKKCWSMDYTSKYITFFEGDDLYGYTCAAIPIDNPKCDGTFPTCPGQCPTRSTIGSGTDTNKCHYSGLCLPLLTCWAPRTEYSCSDISKKTLYYQNACSYISGNVLKYGQVNAYGQCI